MAEYILQILRSQLMVVFSWGFHRPTALPEDGLRLWHTFPTRGWVLLVFMMSLGMALRFVPGVPAAFTAALYSGLGPMLLLSAVRFAARK